MLSMMFIDKNKFNNLEDRQRVNLINSLTGVKSANLIGTQSMDKTTNLSIVSSLFHLGASPALFGFVIRPDSAPRDTLNNLREHPYLTVNHVNTNIIENAHQTSARYKTQESEFNKCSLTEEYSNGHSAPFVKESKIKFAAKMIREISIEENGTHIMICELLAIHLPKECLGEDFFIDITKAKSVGVSGLDQYLNLESFGRASYAKPDKSVKWKT
jgi:flavin reductase (DIM6/NTAB) family NADH-FMN oxidoreductase RutF